MDSLLLGCTHYPYLARIIGEVMGPDVVLVSSADETAFEVRSILSEVGLGAGPPRPARRGGSLRVKPVRLSDLGQHLFGPELDQAEHWEPPLVCNLRVAMNQASPVNGLEAAPAGGGFSITVLGTDGSYPGPAEPAAATCCGAGLHHLAGGGAGLAGQPPAAPGLDQLDAVVVSHAHPDHWSDLEGFYVAMRYFFGRRGVPDLRPRGLARAHERASSRTVRSTGRCRRWR